MASKFAQVLTMKKYPDITNLIEKKEAHRKSMASLPFEEKVKIAFELNKRHKFIKSGTLVPSPSSPDRNTQKTPDTSHAINKNKLKTYAPQARRDFRDAVSARAGILGLLPDTEVRIEVKGDVAIINGQAYTRNVAALRERLLERIAREGFEHFVEEIAYTWFNRFTALRFMEVNGFLPHGLRVFSHPDELKDEPEILEKAHSIELPGLDRERVIGLKLAANKDAELYRLLLIAQCNQLSAAMPFLFERINDDTELLLPDNLLHSDSVIRKLVREIEEDDWRQVEIVGWLYQFYISEKKDEVIGKVVKSEDIPAATQLFTPNWIVKYMTQNSLGRMWLQTSPNSGLRSKMEYYIEPAEQSEEVQRELAKLTPESINPEEIKILDPACGSGHILVEAYDLLKEIYRERGYSRRDIPRLILEKNLYGLDIDERAAQLASFALLMKARSDDRRVLGENAPQLNIVAIPESSHLNAKELAAALLTKRESKKGTPIRDNTGLFEDADAQPSLTEAVSIEVQRKEEQEGFTEGEIVSVLDSFDHGRTLGSLIKIPVEMRPRIDAIEREVAEKLVSPELMQRTAAEQIRPFIIAAKMLTGRYDCVIANPPYMGSKYFNVFLRGYVKKHFPKTKSDLFSVSIERYLSFSKSNGQLAFISPFVWMFLSSYQQMREILLLRDTITSLVQLEYNAFEPACVPVCAFTIQHYRLEDYEGDYIRLSAFRGYQTQGPKALEAINSPQCGWRFRASSKDFKIIPGEPIAYWASAKLREVFRRFPKIGKRAKKGLTTGDNNRFLRLWHEVDEKQMSLNGCDRKWFPTTKGGNFRKWYGNHEFVVNWHNDGRDIRNFVDGKGKPRSVIRNSAFYLKEGITWNDISNSFFNARYVPNNFICNASGPMIFGGDKNAQLSFLNSNVNTLILSFLAPTMHFEVGSVALIPMTDSAPQDSNRIGENAILIAREDWDSFETSWDFQTLPLRRNDLKDATVPSSFAKWKQHCDANIKRMQELETENNRLFIKAYDLEDELSPEVPEEQITLARADAAADTRRLVSFAIGCMMGRYSLDEPGLIYAQSGGKDFDQSRYRTFAADGDGIIPVTDLEWFDDDAANRFSEFVKCAWSNDTHTQNLLWIASQLGPKSTETPIQTIRRYLSAQFFKDHMQTYKKRPIYWLFSSGKQRAFECLIYLHRYNESTLSRMRNEYVTPLFGKLAGRIEYLGGSDGQSGLIGAATSTAEKNKLRKQLEALKKKQIELVAFDDELRHYADMRIKLDLDDGVKVNYGKFGNLLAEVKTITGASSE
jgi:type II restriction/modification system DNA methylase subunit YeeA